MENFFLNARSKFIGRLQQFSTIGLITKEFDVNESNSCVSEFPFIIKSPAAELEVDNNCSDIAP